MFTGPVLGPHLEGGTPTSALSLLTALTHPRKLQGALRRGALGSSLCLQQWGRGRGLASVAPHALHLYWRACLPASCPLPPPQAGPLIQPPTFCAQPVSEQAMSTNSGQGFQKLQVVCVCGGASGRTQQRGRGKGESAQGKNLNKRSLFQFTRILKQEVTKRNTHRSR